MKLLLGRIKANIRFFNIISVCKKIDFFLLIHLALFYVIYVLNLLPLLFKKAFILLK